MRQVFTSARLENVERVAKMLEAEGIEVRIENGRSFRRSIRGSFSYRERGDNGPKPAVWVVRSDDQPRARQMLRDAGLLEDTRSTGSYLPLTPHGHDPKAARNKALRYRIGLFALIGVVALAIMFRPKSSWHDVPVRPAAQQTAIDPSLDQFATATEAIHLIASPPALAAVIAAQEAAAANIRSVCLGIDGLDPPEAVLDALRADGLDAGPASDCSGESLRVNVYAWRTDGSGSGEVTWSVANGPGEARSRNAPARRDGDDWQVDAPR